MKKKFYLKIAFLLVPLLVIVFFYFPSQSKLIRIPISFTRFNTPSVDVKIEDHFYKLQFDLGSKFQLSLDRDTLESIHNKKAYGVAKWRDCKGNFYESPSYILPRIKLGDLVLTDIIVKQENDTCKINTTLWDDKQNKTPSPNQHFGTLGRPLLEKTNLLLDLQNSTIIACNDARQLRKIGIILNQMTKIPFEGGAPGIIIKADTDAGILRLALDTGSTITLIRAARLQDQKCTKDERGFLIFTSQRFFIGNEDFGCKNLFLYDITPELHEIDGLLGMDFLKNHIVYINYKDKVLYIGDSKPRI